MFGQLADLMFKQVKAQRRRLWGNSGFADRKPVSDLGERWVPSPDDVVWLDFDSVSHSEELEIKRLCGYGIDKLFPFSDVLPDVLRAFVCVAVRRRTPDFSLAEAGDLPSGSWRWVISKDDEKEARSSSIVAV